MSQVSYIESLENHIPEFQKSLSLLLIHYLFIERGIYHPIPPVQFDLYTITQDLELTEKR